MAAAIRAIGTSSACSSPLRWEKNSLTRVRARKGDGLAWGSLRRPFLTATGQRECEKKGEGSQAGPHPLPPPCPRGRGGPMEAGEWERADHPKNLFRASATAARTHSGAVPPKLVRLATARSASSTS